MMAYLIFAGSGPIVILTSHADVHQPMLLEKLHAKGIDKFIAYEVPVELARTRYGNQFDVVTNDLHESHDLRVLDYNGQRAFTLFNFHELGPAIMHEPIHVESSL
jgi:hypothetical protein